MIVEALILTGWIILGLSVVGLLVLLMSAIIDRYPWFLFVVMGVLLFLFVFVYALLVVRG